MLPANFSSIILAVCFRNEDFTSLKALVPFDFTNNFFHCICFDTEHHCWPNDQYCPQYTGIGQLGD